MQSRACEVSVRNASMCFGRTRPAYANVAASDGNTSRAIVNSLTSTYLLWRYRIRDAWQPLTPPSHSGQLKVPRNRVSNSSVQAPHNLERLAVIGQDGPCCPPLLMNDNLLIIH